MTNRFDSALAQDACGNGLFAALPEDALLTWLPDLEQIDLTLGQVLYEVEATPAHAYFPTTSIVSLLYKMDNGESAEIAIVGNDGMVGISLFMGGGATSSRAVVQNAGLGFRVTAAVLKRECARGGATLHQLLKYTQALMSQMTLTAACNRHHTFPQQLSRWILLSLDRLKGNEMVMTQQLLANMLGTTPEQVAECASELHQRGLIDYQEGTIIVRDRKGIEASSCECYFVVKAEYDRLLQRAGK